MYERYIMIKSLAGVAELADALDLGSSVNDVGVQVLFPAPLKPLLLKVFYFYQKLIYLHFKLKNSRCYYIIT